MAFYALGPKPMATSLLCLTSMTNGGKSTITPYGAENIIFLLSVAHIQKESQPQHGDKETWNIEI